MGVTVRGKKGKQVNCGLVAKKKRLSLGYGLGHRNPGPNFNPSKTIPNRVGGPERALGEWLVLVLGAHPYLGKKWGELNTNAENIKIKKSERTGRFGWNKPKPWPVVSSLELRGLMA